MKHTLKSVFVVAASAACLAWGALAAAEMPKSMRGGDVPTDIKAPELKSYQGGKPGGQDKLARTFEGHPPLIPHALANFDEITLEDNQCLSCHDKTTYEKKKAPKVGDSHFKNREGAVLSTMSPARYNCLQCHVPQVDAPPLVDNLFKGNVAATQ